MNDSNQTAPPSLVNLDPVVGFINVIWEGKPNIIRASDRRWLKAVDLYKAGQWQEFILLASTEFQVNKAFAAYGDVQLRDGEVFYQDYPIHNTMTQRILEFVDLGLDVQPLICFFDKLMNNPSKRAVDELYTFLEHKNMPITSNGNFLAYKGVQSNYTDVRTGTFSNVVGATLSMPRNRVDDDKEIGCSEGFHAGSMDYAAGFMPQDGHLMVVEINPADVVSVPTDCQCQKLRTSRYKVVDEYKEALTHPVYLSRFVEYDEDDEDAFEEDEFISYCENCGDRVEDVCSTCDNCDDCCFCDDESDEVVEAAPDPLSVAKRQIVDAEGQSLQDGAIYFHQGSPNVTYRYDASTDFFEEVRYCKSRIHITCASKMNRAD